MQSILEGLISKLIEGDPKLVKVVDKMAKDKNREDIRKVTNTDVKSMYDFLETLDTIKED